MKFKDLNNGDVFQAPGLTDVDLVKIERVPDFFGDGYNTLMLPWFDVCYMSEETDVTKLNKKVKVVENEN